MYFATSYLCLSLRDLSANPASRLICGPLAENTCHPSNRHGEQLMWHVTEIYVVHAALARSCHHYLSPYSNLFGSFKKTPPPSKNGVWQPTDAGDLTLYL